MISKSIQASAINIQLPFYIQRIRGTNDTSYDTLYEVPLDTTLIKVLVISGEWVVTVGAGSGGKMKLRLTGHDIFESAGWNLDGAMLDEAVDVSGFYGVYNFRLQLKTENAADNVRLKELSLFFGAMINMDMKNIFIIGLLGAAAYFILKKYGNGGVLQPPRIITPPDIGPKPAPDIVSPPAVVEKVKGNGKTYTLGEATGLTAPEVRLESSKATRKKLGTPVSVETYTFPSFAAISKVLPPEAPRTGLKYKAKSGTIFRVSGR